MNSRVTSRARAPIQPIATTFCGIVYRSRLEARWAAFFTRVGLDFTYEPEGYELSGGWYLPDFNIGTWGVFAEVKPEAPIPGEQAKCRELARLSARKVLMLIGQPAKARAVLYCPNGFETEASLAQCRRCPSIVVAYDEGDAWGFEAFGCCQSKRGLAFCTDKLPSPWSGLETAAQWAQNQKFGERGA